MDTDAQVRQTAEAIRRLVSEIAQLASTDIPRQAFFGAFIQRAVRAIDAMGGAVWIGRQGRFNLVADVDLDSSRFAANSNQRDAIRAALRWVAEHGRSLIIAPMGPDWMDDQGAAGIPNHTPMPFFYVPVRHDDHVVGVVQVWQRPGRDPKSYRGFMEFLIAVAQHAESYLESRHLESVVRERQRLENLLLVTERIGAAESSNDLAVQLVNLGRELVAADRLTLLVCEGRQCRAEAVSGQPRVQRRSETVQAIEDLGRAAVVARDARAFRRPNPGQDASRVCRQYFMNSKYDLIVMMPLKVRDQVAAVIAAEYPAADGHPTDEDLAALESLARQVGPALDRLRQQESLPLRRTARLLASLRPERRNRRLVVAVVLAAIAIAAAVVPIRTDVEGRCTVWPVNRAVVVAHEEGRIAEVLVTEGQRVEVGQPLVRLENPALQTQWAVAQRDVEKWQAEAQSREAEGDPSGAQIASIRADKAAGEVAYLRTRIDALLLRSPIGGSVVTPEPQSNVGRVLARGDTILNVAALEAWEVAVEVPEHSLPSLQKAIAAAGPEGLPVEFVLAARPDRALAARIASADDISQVARTTAGKNVFLVRAGIDPAEAAEADLRIGYEGRARIAGPERSALGALFGPFVDYLRLALF
ncbi:MAG: GAF domain-containing protein [Planctomycetes bacterium]|nr:GAF domain-containing protein [Planctomycetota bacterium]